MSCMACFCYLYLLCLYVTIVIGAAYIFRTFDNGNTWSQAQKFVANGPEPFGGFVSLFGDIFVVAPHYLNIEDSAGWFFFCGFLLLFLFFD
jgi:hypothetical protein